MVFVFPRAIFLRNDNNYYSVTSHLQ